jgi:hypothetical protein
MATAKLKPKLTMSMTFYSQDVRDAFVTLCRRCGLHGTIVTKHAGRPRWVVTVKGFKNRTAMATFTAQWATLSLTPA